MHRVKLLAVSGVACAMLASSTLLVASPAHAEVNDGCHELQVQAIWYDRMTVVLQGAFGADYHKTKEYARSANQAWSSWMESCHG